MSVVCGVCGRVCRCVVFVGGVWCVWACVWCVCVCGRVCRCGVCVDVGVGVVHLGAYNNEGRSLTSTVMGLGRVAVLTNRLSVTDWPGTHNQ